MTGQSHWFDYISAPIIEYERPFCSGFTQRELKGHTGGFGMLFNQTFCNCRYGSPLITALQRSFSSHNTQSCTLTHAFVTTLNKKQGVDVVIAARGGVIPQLRPNKKEQSASRTLFCLETNYFSASQIDFICLCSRARSFSPPRLFDISNSHTSPPLSSFAHSYLSHPAHFYVSFHPPFFSYFLFSSTQGKNRHNCYHLNVCLRKGE